MFMHGPCDQDVLCGLFLIIDIVLYANSNRLYLSPTGSVSFVIVPLPHYTTCFLLSPNTLDRYNEQSSLR